VAPVPLSSLAPLEVDHAFALGAFWPRPQPSNCCRLFWGNPALPGNLGLQVTLNRCQQERITERIIKLARHVNINDPCLGYLFCCCEELKEGQNLQQRYIPGFFPVDGLLLKLQ